MEPSPLVQQILGVGQKESTVPSTTPLSSMSPEAQAIVQGLPHLAYMQARVLMFPIPDS